MDLMDGIQVVPAFVQVIRAVWAHPALASVLDSFGGLAVLDEGLQEMRVGSYQVVADLLAAREFKVSLADAVFDSDNFPHLARLHGRIFDFMSLRVPALWAPLIKTILRLQLPDEGLSFRRMVAQVAFRSMNIGESSLAQLMLFEVLCIHQRLALLRKNEALESLGGQRRDIEILAQTELEMPISVDEYKNEILTTDDPVQCLVNVATISLLKHIDRLNQELKSLRSLPTDLEAVRQIQERMKYLEPDEALLFRNKTAEYFGEQKMAPEQLQILHPIHLGHHSADSIYQKTHRVTEKVKELSCRIEENGEGWAPESDQRVSLIDIILEVESEQDK